MLNITRIISICGILAIGIAIAGCGGSENNNGTGNGAGNGAGNGGTPPSASAGNGTADAEDGDDHEHGEEASLGTTTIGDITIECAQGHGLTEAGKEMHLIVKLPYNDSGSTVVRAWIGTDDRFASTVSKGEYAASHDDYDIHALAPDPLPVGAMWWIEIEKPDGETQVGSIAYR